MGYKLAITGMDRGSEAAMRETFEQAKSRLDDTWKLASEADADYVVVDMDSMYGPISWIRLHGAGKQVVGLTTAPRSQADYRLGRPFDADSLAELLSTIAGIEPEVDAPEAPAASVSDPLPDAPPAASTPAPSPADELPKEALQEVRAHSAPPPPLVAALEPEPAQVESEQAPAAEPLPEPTREHSPPSAPASASTPGRTLLDLIAADAAPGRWRYRFDGGAVAFDTRAGTYLGPATLKPLEPAFRNDAPPGALEPLDDAAWNAAKAGAESTQPLARLQWYGALLAGNGTLLPGTDPAGQYRLLKWPQTEREFPRHFRIATAMMKGPATLAEVAAASNVPESEVADFVNANLATGHAEFVAPAAPETAAPAKPGGLFGRLRGR